MSVVITCIPTVSEKYSKKYPLTTDRIECVVVKVYCKSSQISQAKALTIRVAALDFGIKECFPGSNLHY